MTKVLIGTVVGVLGGTNTTPKPPAPLAVSWIGSEMLANWQTCEAVVPNDGRVDAFLDGNTKCFKGEMDKVDPYTAEKGYKEGMNYCLSVNRKTWAKDGCVVNAQTITGYTTTDAKLQPLIKAVADNLKPFELLMGSEPTSDVTGLDEVLKKQYTDLVTAVNKVRVRAIDMKRLLAEAQVALATYPTVKPSDMTFDEALCVQGAAAPDFTKDILYPVASKILADDVKCGKAPYAVEGSSTVVATTCKAAMVKYHETCKSELSRVIQQAEEGELRVNKEHNRVAREAERQKKLAEEVEKIATAKKELDDAKNTLEKEADKVVLQYLARFNLAPDTKAIAATQVGDKTESSSMSNAIMITVLVVLVIAVIAVALLAVRQTGARPSSVV